jgi:hypothetical protein
MPAAVLDPLSLEGVRSDAATAFNDFESIGDVRRDAYRLGYAAVGVGSAVIGCLWLALYVIAVLHTLMW